MKNLSIHVRLCRLVFFIPANRRLAASRLANARAGARVHTRAFCSRFCHLLSNLLIFPLLDSLSLSLSIHYRRRRSESRPLPSNQTFRSTLQCLLTSCAGITHVENFFLLNCNVLSIFQCNPSKRTISLLLPNNFCPVTYR